MSMILGLTTISDRTAAQVFADPPLLWRLIAPADPEAYQQEVTKYKSAGFLSRFLGKGANKTIIEVPTLDLEEWEGRSQDLEKAWQGIHYLLTMTAWEGDPPLNFLLKGGREVPVLVVGYGAARIITSQEARTIHNALSEITFDHLQSRFNPSDMMSKEIYPEIWDRDPTDDDTLGYLLEYFKLLKRFVADAVGNQLGFVITIE